MKRSEIADLRHLSGPEQVLELAVGNRCDLAGRTEEELDQKNAGNGRDPVPGMEAVALVHEGLPQRLDHWVQALSPGQRTT